MSHHLAHSMSICMDVVGASSGLDLQLDVLIISGELTNCFVKMYLQSN